MKRSQLKNLAAGLCTSFISRNNRIEGYWGLGKIYQFAKENDVLVVEFDLIKLVVSPSTQIFDSVLHQYALWLKNRVAGYHKENDILVATISVKFNVRETKSAYRQTYGDLFEVLVSISDNRKNRVTINAYNCCAPHDPSRESQSATY